MTYSPLLELTLARVREFLREPEALFWVFAFPVLLALALGIAFRSRAPETVRVAVESAPAADTLAAALGRARGVAAEVVPAAEAAQRLRTGRVAIVVAPAEPIVYRYDSTRAESRLARLVVDDALQRAYGRRDVRAVADQRVAEKGSRYIDFLIPGLLGMNLMGTGMWGVGFSIVQTRTRKLLKRLLASPMRKSHYLLSHILARLVFLSLEVVALLGFGYLAFGVPVRGSIAALAVIVVLGAMSFAGLGLLISSRAKTIEGVSGLMNVVMMPMWILSGVFFSAALFPDPMQPFIRALPLTALNDALRAVMTDGAPLLATAGALAIVAGWGTASFAVALKIFRWS